MAFLRITGITLRGAPHLRHITHVHGAFGSKSIEQAVEDIRQGTHSFYTKSPFAFDTTRIEVVVPYFGLVTNALWGRPTGAYLRSEPTWAMTDSLLSLPRVPSLAGSSMDEMAGALRR